MTGSALELSCEVLWVLTEIGDRLHSDSEEKFFFSGVLFAMLLDLTASLKQ